MSAPPKHEPMRLDRTVTLSILFAVFLQTAGVLVWGGAAAARLEALERRAERSQQISERMVRLEEQMLMARESLTRIEKQLQSHPVTAGHP